MTGGSSNKPSKSLSKKKNARFGKSRPGKGSGSGSQNGPQRTRVHADVHASGLMVVYLLKEATNSPAFTGDLTAAIEDDQSFCEKQMCLGSFAQRCAVSGEVMTFKTANNRTFARKCLVFFVDSDEDVTEKVKIVSELFSEVTKPYVSKTGVVGRPHLGVPGKITGSIGSADLPNIIAAVGTYKTAHIVGCLHHGDLLDGTMDFDLLPEYFGSSFDRKYAEKLVIEAFEEDTGLKVGSGIDEDHEDEEEDNDQVGGPGETETKDDDERKSGKTKDKDD